MRDEIANITTIQNFFTLTFIITQMQWERGNCAKFSVRDNKRDINDWIHANKAAYRDLLKQVNRKSKVFRIDFNCLAESTEIYFTDQGPGNEFPDLSGMSNPFHYDRFFQNKATFDHYLEMTGFE